MPGHVAETQGKSKDVESVTVQDGAKDYGNASRSHKTAVIHIASRGTRLCDLRASVGYVLARHRTLPSSLRADC